MSAKPSSAISGKGRMGVLRNHGVLGELGHGAGGRVALAHHDLDAVRAVAFALGLEARDGGAGDRRRDLGPFTRRAFDPPLPVEAERGRQ